jgi:GH24 family phage-related lysozyme (muramidase)
MTPSSGIIEFIETVEGFRRSAYPDPLTGGEPWTVGYGSTTIKGQRVKPFQLVDKAEAHEEVVARLHTLGDILAGNLPRERLAELTQGRADALISILDNVGPGSASRSGILRLKTGEPSTLWQRVLDGKWSAARSEFARWVAPGSRVTRGLTMRRIAEMAIWDGMDPMSAYYAIWGDA